MWSSEQWRAMRALVAIRLLPKKMLFLSCGENIQETQQVLLVITQRLWTAIVFTRSWPWRAGSAHPNQSYAMGMLLDEAEHGLQNLKVAKITPRVVFNVISQREEAYRGTCWREPGTTTEELDHNILFEGIIQGYRPKYFGASLGKLEAAFKHLSCRFFGKRWNSWLIRACAS